MRYEELKKKDDPSFVVERKANKLAVTATVTPLQTGVVKVSSTPPVLFTILSFSPLFLPYSSLLLRLWCF
jgi:hypothetical protein